MQYDLFADLDFNTQTPFSGRVICLLGTFSIPTKQIAKKLCDMGADCKTSYKVSRNTHFVLVGENPPSDQMEALQTLNFHGYHPRRLSETDYRDICSGHYAPYEMPEKIQKTLHLTMQHFLFDHPTLQPTENILYTHELYVAPNTKTPKNVLLQRLGDRGIYANSYIDDTTEFIVLGESSLQKLQEGESDATLHEIEQQYNLSNAQTYRYIMFSENEIMEWLTASSNLETTTN